MKGGLEMAHVLLKSIAIGCLLGAGLALCACATSQADASAREWQRAECNKVIDKEDRDHCLKRADDAYGARSRESEKAPAKR
jgi:hypothetical protein